MRSLCRVARNRRVKLAGLAEMHRIIYKLASNAHACCMVSSAALNLFPYLKAAGLLRQENSPHKEPLSSSCQASALFLERRDRGYLAHTTELISS